MNRFRLLLRITIAALFISAFFSNCAKEYSFEGAPPRDSAIVVNPPDSVLATYEITGTPGFCTDPGIRGSYFAYQKMGAANYAELLVNVSIPGYYSIATDTIDGVYFSAKGKFTNTGSQRVTLQANGTLTYPQDLLFITSGASSSCVLPLTVVTPGFPATYVLESSYDSTCTAHSVSGMYTKGIVLNTGNTVAIKTYVTVAGAYTISSNKVNGISFRYTGLFSNTGIIYVNLTGYGTPLAAGNFTYRLHIIGPAPIGGESCLFDVTTN